MQSLWTACRAVVAFLEGEPESNLVRARLYRPDDLDGEGPSILTRLLTAQSRDVWHLGAELEALRIAGATDVSEIQEALKIQASLDFVMADYLDLLEQARRVGRDIAAVFVPTLQAEHAEVGERPISPRSPIVPVWSSETA